MIGGTLQKAWFAFCLAFLLCLTRPAFADEPAEPDSTPATEAVEADVQAEANAETQELRKAILEDAVDALQKSREALTALEEDRIDEALDALAFAAGKLELIVARDPELALAATDVSIRSHDLYATTESIETAIDIARKALKDGDIQKARHILDGMGSEIVITVHSLPLATYPDAIKAVTPLIDAGKIGEATERLQAALNTMVLEDHILPLPILRAGGMLEVANDLASKEERNDEELRQLEDALSYIREQLELGAILGYGDRDAYEDLVASLDDIEEQIGAGEPVDKLLAGIRESLDEVLHGS